MTPHMLDFVRAASWYAGVVGPVLEIGSYIEADQDHLDLRRAFPPGAKYVGVDANPGPGVDHKADLLDEDHMLALVDEVKPTAILCLYTVEHLWEIRRAMAILAAMWHRAEHAWLWVATHQNQPFHGTDKYPDYWRVTAAGLRKLAAEASAAANTCIDPGTNARIYVHGGAQNPDDVAIVAQPRECPAAVEDVFACAVRAAPGWGQYC